MATEATDTKTCDKSFCEDHLLLSPKDVGLRDLITLLFSKNIANRKGIDCPAGTTEETFTRRFVIFISIVAQKVLLLLYKPLSWVGSAIEFMPNFMLANGGLSKLLFNVVSGKMVLPNKESPEYLTTIGLLDIRRDLDNRIKHEDPRYISALAVMASKSAYENKEHIKETVETHWKVSNLI
ncbi:putative triacylglycerol lipase [Helianthus annuus]|nr:putative triacylglycerol lipase [Helianthus annuus]